MTSAPAPAPASRAARLWKRTWIGALMVAVLAALLVWVGQTGDALPILVVVALLSALGVHELDRIAAFRRGGWKGRLGLPLTVMLVGSVMNLRGTTPDGRVLAGPGWPLLVVVVVLVAFAVAMLRGPGAAEGGALGDRPRPGEALRTALVGAWVVCPLFLLVPLWSRFGLSGLVALVALSKVGDVAGYYVGSAIGRRHPFPRISPGKTAAGCVASLVAAVLAGVALAAAGVPPGAGVLGGALAGASVNVAAQAGDLLESWVKRRSGAKDSGPWFGPAGGVLDLVDSLLLSVPVALLIWPSLFTP